MQHAGELTFLNSTSNLEEFNLRVFLLVTQSPVGALPLSVLITSNEQTDTLISGLIKLRDSFPCDSAFGGVGRMTGPLFMMTDNCSELRDAVSAVWPKTTFQVWRWLNDKKHGADLKHRNKLLTSFKNILYADSEVGMEVAYEELMDDDDSAVYPNFQRYIDTVYEERDVWAVCYRKDSLYGVHLSL